MLETNIAGIAGILGEKNTKKIKDTLTECIVEDIQRQFEEDWVVDMSEVNDYFQEIVEEAEKEIAEEFKEKLKAIMRVRFANIDKILEELT